MPYVKEVSALSSSSEGAYKVDVKEWTWIYYNDGNGGPIDRMGYSVDHEMTIGTDASGTFKLLNNVYDDERFVGKVELKDAINVDLMAI